MLANMADGWQHPSIRQNFHGQSYLFHQPSPNLWTSSSIAHNLSSLYLGGGLHNPPLSALALVSPASHILVRAPVEKEKRDFLVNFLMGGVSAAVSKTAASPIERVKLLLQNQDEMIKVGRLSEPYKGIIDCFTRTIKEEGPQLCFQGFFQEFIQLQEERDDYWKWFAGNMASGGAAGASSLVFVYPLDYARTWLANDASFCLSSGLCQNLVG